MKYKLLIAVIESRETLNRISASPVEDYKSLIDALNKLVGQFNEALDSRIQDTDDSEMPPGDDPPSSPGDTFDDSDAA